MIALRPMVVCDSCSDHQLNVFVGAAIGAVPLTVHERECLLYKAVKLVELAHGAVFPSRAAVVLSPGRPRPHRRPFPLRRTRGPFRSRLRADPGTLSMAPLHLRRWVCLYLDHAPRRQQGLLHRPVRDPFGTRTFDGLPPSAPSSSRPLAAGQVSYFMRCISLLRTRLLISPPPVCVAQFHVLRVVDFSNPTATPTATRAPSGPRHYFALSALIFFLTRPCRADLLVRATQALLPIVPPRYC